MSKTETFAVRRLNAEVYPSKEAAQEILPALAKRWPGIKFTTEPTNDDGWIIVCGCCGFYSGAKL